MSATPTSAANWLQSATEDQQRIEAVLRTLVTPESKLLHVGIGDSGLARRFSGLARWIEGLTVGADELTAAHSLNLPNYTVYFADKYNLRTFGLLEHVPFDFIIDNNLASYSPSPEHLEFLMLSYRHILKPGGRILTDEVGWRHRNELSLDDVLADTRLRIAKTWGSVLALAL